MMTDTNNIKGASQVKPTEYTLNDCTKYYNILEKNGVPVWKCSICDLSSFKHKCLLDMHILNVHLKNKRCTWCHLAFNTLQDLIDHCQNIECRAGVLKHLNKMNGRKLSTGHIHSQEPLNDGTLQNMNGSNQAKCATAVPNELNGNGLLENKVGNERTSNVQTDDNIKSFKKPNVCPENITEHQCSGCGQKFPDDIHLIVHLKNKRRCKMHLKESQNDPEDITYFYKIVIDKNKTIKSCIFQCLKCSSFHPNQFAVKRHIRRKHWKLTRFQCSVCKKQFKDISVWKFHRSNPFHCNNLSTVFSNAVIEDVYHNSGDDSEEARLTCTESKIVNSDCVANNCQADKCGSCSTLKTNTSAQCTPLKESDTITNNCIQHQSREESLTAYKCRLCSQKVLGSNTYVSHLKCHLQDYVTQNKLKCKQCNKEFNHKQTYEYHCNFVHSKHFRCLLCPSVLPSKSRLRVHMVKVHSKGRRVKKKNGKLHMPTTSVDMQPVMSQIQNTSHQKETADNTLGLHESHDQSNRNSKSCLVCGVEFQNIDTYKFHVKLCKRTFPCQYCSQLFQSLSEKRNHEKKAHASELIVQCEDCHKFYKGFYRLKFHRNMYHGKRKSKYACTDCSYKSWNKYALKQHRYKHSELAEEKFKCPYCDKKFNSMNSLGRHKVLHTNKKNYECHVCMKTFSQKCTLSRHMDSHNKLKRYKCAVCQKRFTQSYPLAKHVQVFHPDMMDQFQKERLTDKWRNSEPEPEVIMPIKKPSCKPRLNPEVIHNSHLGSLNDRSFGKLKVKHQLLSSKASSHPTTAVLPRHSIPTIAHNTKSQPKYIIITPQAGLNVSSPPLPRCEHSIASQPAASTVQSSASTCMQQAGNSTIMENYKESDFPQVVSPSPVENVSLANPMHNVDPFAFDSVMDFPHMFGLTDMERDGETNLETSLSSQGNVDDNFLDFLSYPVEATHSLNSFSGSLNLENSTKTDAVILDENHTSESIITEPVWDIVEQNEELPESHQDAYNGDLNPQDDGKTYLETIEGVPSWANEPLVLIQDGEESYVVSASNLAQLANGLSENILDT